MLSFGLLSVSYLLLNAPRFVVLPDDIAVGQQPCEDRYFVDLEFFQPHEEVIYVPILSLHYKFGNRTGQLFLFGRYQGVRRK